MQELGQPEISDVRFKTRVKKYVVGFHIAMEDQRGTIVVKITKPFGGLDSNLIPCVPIQLGWIIVENLFGILQLMIFE